MSRDDQHRWWKLTAFLSFALMPALRITTGDARHGLDLSQSWMHTTLRFPGLFRGDRTQDGFWENHGLFMSVGCSAALCRVCNMSVLFTRKSEEVS